MARRSKNTKNANKEEGEKMKGPRKGSFSRGKRDFRAEHDIKAFHAKINFDPDDDETDSDSGNQMPILGEYEMMEEEMDDLLNEETETLEDDELEEYFLPFPVPEWGTEPEHPDWDLVPSHDRKLLQLMMEKTDVGYIFNPDDTGVKIDKETRNELMLLETTLITERIYDDAFESAFNLIDPVLMIRSIMTNLRRRVHDYMTVTSWERRTAKHNRDWHDYMTGIITDVIEEVPSLQSVGYVRSQMKKWDLKPVKDILFCGSEIMFRKLWAKKPVASKFVPYDIMSPVSVTDFHPKLAQSLMEKSKYGHKIYDIASDYNKYKKKFSTLAKLMLCTLKDNLSRQKGTEPIFSESKMELRSRTIQNSKKCCPQDTAFRKVKPSISEAKRFEREFFDKNAIKPYHTLEMVLKTVISDARRLDKTMIPCSALNYTYQTCQETLARAGDLVVYSSDNESEREYCERYNVPYEIERKMKRCSYYYRKKKYKHPRTYAYCIMKKLRRSLRALTGRLTKRKPWKRYRDLLYKLCPKRIDKAEESLYSISNPSELVHKISNKYLRRDTKEMRIDWLHHRCGTINQIVHSTDYARSEGFRKPELDENLSEESSENLSYYNLMTEPSESYTPSDSLTGELSSVSHLDYDSIHPMKNDEKKLKFIKRPRVLYPLSESAETIPKSPCQQFKFWRN